MFHKYKDEKNIQNFSQETSRDETTQKLKHIWEDNINVNLNKMGYKDVHWNNQAQNRVQQKGLMNRVMNFGFHER
jgi:hypothetical protein